MAVKNKNWFTLVELVVVIIILAILSSVAVISFKWYSLKSRNWVRLSDINNIETSLELYSTEYWEYPLPVNWTVMTYDWDEQWKQWTFDIELWNLLWNLDKLPIDPKTKQEYIYSKSLWLEEFELKYDLEDETAYNPIYAAWEINKISWNYNWIYNIWKSKKYYSAPSLIIADSNINTTVWQPTNFYINWRIDEVPYIIDKIADNKPDGEAEYITFTTNLQADYNTNVILKEIPEYKTLIDYWTDDTKKEYLAWALLWEKSWITYEEIVWPVSNPVYSCSWTKAVLAWPTMTRNATSVTWDFEWQSTHPTEPCYFWCSDNYYNDWGTCVNWCKVWWPIWPWVCAVKP